MDRFDAGKALLIASGFGAVRHSGRVLLDHLIGTHNVLQAWQASESLCLAGLFHSVYGTEGFHLERSANLMRDAVAHAIGPDAEATAWLFGMMKQPRFWRLVRSYAGQSIEGRHFLLVNRSTNEELSCSADEFRRLANLTLANAIEQAGHLPERYGTEKRRQLVLLLPYVLPLGIAEFERLVVSAPASRLPDDVGMRSGQG